jgi:DNA polymerase-1
VAKVLLLDGNSLTYRAFFALPADMATASGQVTNAVFGFTSMLINLLRDHRPDRVIVAFDRPEPTFRHEAIADYKANRSEAPDILRQQVGLVRQVVETLRIPIVEKAGFEADDLIATLATTGRDAGDHIVIVTGDRDTYQLVEDPLVQVLYNRRGVSDYVLYDEAGIRERTGVTPAQYPEYAALRGDPSDNLPGVPGVGEKTAAKLITTYGGLDGVFAHLDEQSPKLRQNLAEHEQRVRVNAKVMVLDRSVPLDVTPDELLMGRFDPEEVRRLFDFLEFRTLYDRLAEAVDTEMAPVAAAGVLEAEVREAAAPAEAVELLEELAGAAGAVAVAPAWAGDEGRSAIVGLALVDVAAEAGDGPDAPTGVVGWLPGEVLGDDRVVAALRHLTRAGGPPLWGHGVKELMRALRSAPAPVDVRSLGLDTMLAAYLLDPAESRYRLDELLARYTGHELPADEVEAGQLDLGGTGDHAARAARRALAVARLGPALLAALDAQGLRRLHDEIEAPLVRVLAKMEEVGVAVDVAELRRLRDELAGEAEALTKEIWNLAGEEFNVNSTLKLRELLFGRLGLSPSKKTKTGYSTDAASLEKLRGQHEIVDRLLEYREVEKLRSTYGDALLAEVDQRDGRIHATFNQTVARTGRLSSDQPNLHNIPVRTEMGRAFRKAFVPAPGHALLIADYNQIELRCIAHLAEDPGLIGAFEAGTDIHTETAARIFGVEPSGVTVDMRSKAKMVSYGLAYGMEAFGLGQRLGIPTDEAALILAAYFEAFPTARSTRPASGATPRPCSAAAAPSRSCSRRTTASARPGSARP